MSKAISQVNAAPAGDTFQIWVDRTNEVINAVSTIAVTVNTHANGGLTTGNGFVEGVFGGRNLVANTMRGGTVQTAANLTFTSNVNITGTILTFGTVAINSSSISINSVPLTPGGHTIVTNTSGTAAQEVDNFDKFAYRGASYMFCITDNNANAYQVTKLLLVHASGEAYVTEYGAVYSNSTQGEFSANANSTHVRVYLTPVSTNTHVSGTRETVDV